jgi:hypothetical protein
VVAKQKRQIQPYSREVRQLFGLPTYKDKSFSGKKDDAHVSVYDTLKEIEFIAQNRSYQTEKLANYLRANNLENTLKNIFDFLYTHIQYVQDSETAEQVRTPLRLLAEQQGDCDCYTAFIACILTNLRVPFYLKMTDYGMIDDFGQPVGYQHVYISVPQQGKDYIVDVVLDNFNQEAAGIYKAYYYPMNGAAPRETEQPKATSINGLNGNRGLGDPATIIVGLVGLGISLVGNYNKGVENDRAVNASEDRKIFGFQDLDREELYTKWADGEGKLIMAQIQQLRAGVSLRGFFGLGRVLNFPNGLPDYYAESNSFTELHEQAGLALKIVHEKWGAFGDHDWSNRYANVVTRDVIFAYRTRVEFRKEVCKALFEAGEISEYESMQIVNYGWQQAPPYPQGVSLMHRHGTQAYAENKNADAFVRKPTYTEAQLKAASKIVKNQVPAQSKGSNVKGESTNTNNSTSPKSEEDFLSKHWKTPTGKAAIIGGGVVGGLLLIGLVKAII